jgi:peroxiredoxin
VELREELRGVEDLVILYVLAEGQINAKTRRFIDEGRLRERVRFLADRDSRLIDALGLRKQDPEPIEEGVAHPATYLLDRQGRVRLADVREDYHIWLDPKAVLEVLAQID